MFHKHILCVSTSGRTCIYYQRRTSSASTKSYSSFRPRCRGRASCWTRLLRKTYGNIFWPVHEILVPIWNVQKPPYADISSGARGLNFGLSLHLHPYFVFVSCEGSGEPAPFCKLSWALIAHMGESFQDYSWIQDFEADFLLMCLTWSETAAWCSISSGPALFSLVSVKWDPV